MPDGLKSALTKRYVHGRNFSGYSGMEQSDAWIRSLSQLQRLYPKKTFPPFLDRMKGNSLILVAEGEGYIYGMIELKEDRHVAMLFGIPVLSSVPAYKKYGFECAGDTGESAGLIYQPMRIEL